MKERQKHFIKLCDDLISGSKLLLHVSTKRTAWSQTNWVVVPTLNRVKKMFLKYPTENSKRLDLIDFIGFCKCMPLHLFEVWESPEIKLMMHLHRLRLGLLHVLPDIIEGEKFSTSSPLYTDAIFLLLTDSLQVMKDQISSQRWIKPLTLLYFLCCSKMENAWGRCTIYHLWKILKQHWQHNNITIQIKRYSLKTQLDFCLWSRWEHALNTRLKPKRASCEAQIPSDCFLSHIHKQTL